MNADIEVKMIKIVRSLTFMERLMRKSDTTVIYKVTSFYYEGDNLVIETNNKIYYFNTDKINEMYIEKYSSNEEGLELGIK